MGGIPSAASVVHRRDAGGIPQDIYTNINPFQIGSSSQSQWALFPSQAPEPHVPVNDDFDMMGLSPTSWLNQLLHSATANPALPLITTNQLETDPTFDWGFSDLTQNIFDPIATRPSTPAIGQGQGRGEEPAKDELVVAVSAEEVDGRPHAKELPDGRPPESPWVSHLSLVDRSWSLTCFVRRPVPLRSRLTTLL